MSRRQRRLHTARPNRAGRRLVIVAGIVAVLVLLVFGRGLVANLACRLAAREMDKWSLSAAQQWLERAAWLDPDSGEVELMRATCYRRWGDPDRWHRAMTAAAQMGAPADRIQLEKRLAALGLGQLYSDAETLLVELVEAGASPQDVGTALLGCFFAHKQYGKARVFLEQLEAAYSNDAHVAYLWGSYWLKLEEFERAKAQFQLAVSRQPCHELAHEMIAEQLEIQGQLDLALEQHLEAVSRFPESTLAKVGLARVLRRLNRTSEARSHLTPLTLRPDPPVAAVLETAQLELESGNYREADRWFASTDLERHHEQLIPAAITATLVGDSPRAERLIARYDIAAAASQRASDLQIRVSLNSADTEAADELRRLSLRSADAAKKASNRAPGQRNEGAGENSVMSASELYALHCSACHGAEGDGNGRAARQLFPRPRDLQTGRSRLVSTLNNVPRLEDLVAVTRRGMTGTSMPAFEDLNEDELGLLAQEVQRLNREGVRKRFINMLKEQGEEIDEDDVREVVELCTEPGEVIRVPRIGSADSQAIARGGDVYIELGCDKCHGADGVGAEDTRLFDDKGRPSRPRDLVREAFKGGQEPESMYLRIRAGMPGTPHPGCRDVSDEKLVDLIHYCRSLSQEPKPVLTNHERFMLATSRAYLSARHRASSP